MEKFIPDNYRRVCRDVRDLFTLLDELQLSRSQYISAETAFPTADALLMAAVEIWKHQNPWIQPEYGFSEDEF